MLYYRLLKKDVKEAEKVVAGQVKTVAEKNTVVTRVCDAYGDVIPGVCRKVCCMWCDTKWGYVMTP